MRDKTKQSAYMTYNAMKQRCYDKNHSRYSAYGGRGITICDRWLRSFNAFFEDMGPRPFKMSIERIDNNGNYEPENCKWATRKEQARNTRKKRTIVVDGIERHVAEIAEEHGINLRTFTIRLARGWPLEKALSREKLWNTASLPLAVAAHAAKKKAQTHCKRGHEFTDENTKLYNGRRICKECRRLRDRIEYHR